MGVNTQIFCFVIMPCDVHIARPLSWQTLQKFYGIVAVVNAIHIHIVYIKQQMAVGLSNNGVNKFTLAHFLQRRAIIRGIFDRNSLTKNILGLANASSHITYGFCCEGYGQQIIKLSIVAAVT